MRSAERGFGLDRDLVLRHRVLPKIEIARESVEVFIGIRNYDKTLSNRFLKGAKKRTPLRLSR